MQSTGQTSTQLASFTAMQGSAITYVIFHYSGTCAGRAFTALRERKTIATASQDHNSGFSLHLLRHRREVACRATPGTLLPHDATQAWDPRKDVCLQNRVSPLRPERVAHADPRRPEVSGLP